MAEEPGFVIDEEHYPYPDTLEFGDTLLIRRLTGLGTAEWAELEEDDDRRMVCFVGMAIRHKKPQLSLDKIEKLVETVDIAQLKVIAPPEADAVPPAEAAEDATSETSSTGSTNGAAEPSSVTQLPARTGTQA